MPNDPGKALVQVGTSMMAVGCLITLAIPCTIIAAVALVLLFA